MLLVDIQLLRKKGREEKKEERRDESVAASLRLISWHQAKKFIDDVMSLYAGFSMTL